MGAPRWDSSPFWVIEAVAEVVSVQSFHSHFMFTAGARVGMPEKHVLQEQVPELWDIQRREATRSLC